MQPESNFFNLGFSETDIASLNRMYYVISSMNAWDILARCDVPGDSGFVNPCHPDPSITAFLISLKELNIESFGFVMRQMEFIAKKGWFHFVLERRETI